MQKAAWKKIGPISKFVLGLQIIHDAGGLNTVQKLLLLRWRRLAEENLANPHASDWQTALNLPSLQIPAKNRTARYRGPRGFIKVDELASRTQKKEMEQDAENRRRYDEGSDPDPEVYTDMC